MSQHGVRRALRDEDRVAYRPVLAGFDWVCLSITLVLGEIVASRFAKVFGDTFPLGAAAGALELLCKLTIAPLPLWAELLTGWRFTSLLGAVVRNVDGSRPGHVALLVRFSCKWSWVAFALAHDQLTAQGAGPAVISATKLIYASLLGFTALSMLVAPTLGRRTWYDVVSGTAVFGKERLVPHEARGFEVMLNPAADATLAPEDTKSLKRAENTDRQTAE